MCVLGVQREGGGRVWEKGQRAWAEGSWSSNSPAEGCDGLAVLVGCGAAGHNVPQLWLHGEPGLGGKDAGSQADFPPLTHPHTV